MAGQLTRKELVLQLLQRHRDEWVDGTAIASAEVGGSEGLKRLRELRQDGHNIRMRKHPDPRRDIYQYRLVTASGGPVVQPPAPYIPPSTPGMEGRNFPLTRNEDGSIEVVWEVCEECGGRYSIKVDHINGPEHQRWLREGETMSDRTVIPEPVQPPIGTFTEMPEHINFGEIATCPRCHGVRRRKKGVIEPRCSDPVHPRRDCMRCNGFGIVPNQGPVTMTKPPAPPPVPEPEEAPTQEAFTDG